MGSRRRRCELEVQRSRGARGERVPSVHELHESLMYGQTILPARSARYVCTARDVAWASLRQVTRAGSTPESAVWPCARSFDEEVEARRDSYACGFM